jgi:hypothetical protein
VEALAPEREASHQEEEERGQRDPGMLPEVRESLGLLAEMELVVAEFGKVCQTGRYPLLSIVPARTKREKRVSARARTDSAPANYRKRGGFATAPPRCRIQQSTSWGFSLFAGARAAPRPAPTQ